MVIRRQPVISWLLEKNYFFDPTKISILRVENIIHQEYLLNGMRHLAQVREMNPDWGLPELLMPSFKKVMGKSEKSFSTIEPQLFQEFYREKVCGILIDGEITIVYGFGENQAYVCIFILALKKQIIEISVVVKRYWVTLFSEVGLGRKEAGCMLLCLVYL